MVRAAEGRHIRYARGVEGDEHGEGLRGRLSRQGEEALGKLAEELVGNPFVNAAVARAFDARERAVQAQEVAMGAMNIPSAADIERLTRRLRSVSQRLEGIEDGVDGLDERLAPLSELSQRLGSLEETLERVEATDGSAAGLAEVQTSLKGLDRRSKSVEKVPDRLKKIEARLERMDRRLRSVAASNGQKRLEQAVAGLGKKVDSLVAADRKGGSKNVHDETARDIAALRAALVPEDGPVPRAQERLTVTE